MAKVCIRNFQSSNLAIIQIEKIVDYHILTIQIKVFEIYQFNAEVIL
jgi:hypothetical protein